MRDAGPQSPQERRARRDRDLAGRVSLSIAVVVRFAIAILFDALAFVIWNVGTRPPLRLLRDVASARRAPGRLAAGLVRFAIGLALLLLAGVVAAPAIPTTRAYTILETLMLVAALIVEQLIGDDLRGVARKRAV